MTKANFEVHLKDADAKVLEKYKNLASIKKLKGEDAYWRAMRLVIKSDPWFMMRVALDWGWLDEDIVSRDLLGFLHKHWGTDMAIALPRGHGKTQPMSAIICHQIICNPNISILQVNRTHDNAKKFNSAVAETLMNNEILQRCFGVAHNPDGFLPSSNSDTNLWGEKGLVVAKRKPRFDPNLLCISIDSAMAGKHPDFIYVDDPTEEQNNTPEGYAQVEQFIRGCWMLLPADGFFIWTGTRWGDGDPIGMAINKKLMGKQGHFNSIVRSCYVDDMKEKGVYYPAKKRWNMDKITGYTQEQLDMAALPKPEGMGQFFSAQMRNDPKPAELQDIKVSDIHIYDPAELPALGKVIVMGIETTGGGLPIYSGFNDYLEEQHVSIPVDELESPRNIPKHDRILAALQPPIDKGLVYALDWMIGDESSTENLGYELRRLGVGTHDDIADALHNITHLQKGVIPSKGMVADVYIAVDLAWSEKKRADYTVAIAVAVDDSGRMWILDYERFKASQPTAIYQRLIAFYNKINEMSSEPMKTSRFGKPTKRFAGTWR